MIQDQIKLFVFYLLCGILISITFDFFRSLRKSIKTTDLTTNLEDIIFLITTGIFLVLTIYKYNYGELRLFIPIAITIGIFVYYHFLSKNVVKIYIVLIKTSIKIFNSIRGKIVQVIGKPFFFIVINIKKIAKKVKKNKFF